MKRTETIDVMVCDLCETHATWEGSACRLCERMICRTCIDEGKAVELPSGMYFTSSDDPRWCAGCVTVDSSPLRHAATQLLELRKERRAFDESMELRSKACEAAIARARRRRGGA